MKVCSIDKELINCKVVDSTSVNVKICLVNDICKRALKLGAGFNYIRNREK